MKLSQAAHRAECNENITRAISPIKPRFSAAMRHARHFLVLRHKKFCPIQQNMSNDLVNFAWLPFRRNIFSLLGR